MERLFMYAENYIYTPAVQRAAEFIRAKKSVITYLRGEESVQGSPTAGAGYWKNIGGGTLLRIGCHPLGGMLYLKQEQARARGEEFGIHSLAPKETSPLVQGISMTGPCPGQKR